MYPYPYRMGQRKLTALVTAIQTQPEAQQVIQAQVAPGVYEWSTLVSLPTLEGEVGIWGPEFEQANINGNVAYLLHQKISEALNNQLPGLNIPYATSFDQTSVLGYPEAKAFFQKLDNFFRAQGQILDEFYNPGILSSGDTGGKTFYRYKAGIIALQNYLNRFLEIQKAAQLEQQVGKELAEQVMAQITSGAPPKDITTATTVAPVQEGVGIPTLPLTPKPQIGGKVAAWGGILLGGLAILKDIQGR